MRWVAATLLVASSALAEPPADAVLASLGAADAARAALAREQSEWDLERGRQAALVGALRAEATRIGSEAARDEERAQLIAAGADTAAIEAERVELRAKAAARAAAVEARLRTIAPRWSMDPTDGTAGGMRDGSGDGTPHDTDGIDPNRDAVSRLRTALGRLAAAEQAAAEVEVSIDTGLLGDETVAVQIVRLGVVAAWWRALDGAAAGTVEYRDGRRVLVPVAAPGDAVVAEAIAVASRQRPPGLVDLPVPAPSEAP